MSTKPVLWEERRVSPERVTFDTTGDRRIRGVPVTFNTVSRVLMSQRIGPFRERILPSAVDRVLSSGAEVKALWNHNESEVLGSRQAGTLTLRKMARGLEMDLDPPRWASRYVESVERGDVNGMSFGFLVPEGGDEWDFHTDDGVPLRSVGDMVFREVSITAFPAYEGTSVEVSQRSVDLFLERQAHGVPYEWRSKFHDIMQDR